MPAPLSSGEGDNASTLEHALRREYDIRASQIVRLRIDSYNQHYAVVSELGPLHVKVYAVSPEHTLEQRIAEVHYSHRIVQKLSNSKCGLILDYLRTIEGETLAHLGGLAFDVAPHVRMDPEHKLSGAELGAILAKIHIAMRQIDVGGRPGRSSLRFAPVGLALNSMLEHAERMMMHHVARPDWERVVENIKKLKDWWAQCATDESLSVGVIHGDFDKSNVLISEQGRHYVIDFDCAYIDAEAIDVAHGMLSAACTEYFAGQVIWSELSEFLRAYQIHSLMRLTSSQIRNSLIHLMLKKMCLVKKPEHLKVRERLTIMDDLSRMIS